MDPRAGLEDDETKSAACKSLRWRLANALPDVVILGLDPRIHSATSRPCADADTSA
jgi:hypothetical protein